MRVDLRWFEGEAPQCVVASSTYADLRARDRLLHLGARPELLVWKRAFRDPGLLSTPDWPLHLLDGLPSGEGWSWTMRADGIAETTYSSRYRAAVVAACGLHQRKPSGNLRLTLHARAYRDQGDLVGGSAWWSARATPTRVGLAGLFLADLVAMLAEAKAAGAALLVEQIVILLGKDPRRQGVSLAPRLHRDGQYGAREACVASLLEAGWNSNGGTLTLPCAKPGERWTSPMADLVTLDRDFPMVPVLRSESGDVLIFDGMVDRDGEIDEHRGLLHLSPDVVGDTSRLAILMRHRPSGAP